ncbi:oxidoreductase-like domain-containing protein [Denitromonas ohlonensis]|uniref:Oxidoreductase n=2 Tax=Denitromonas TaxID=139331 RepID=A0A557S5Y6_9RHOO|nr:oxidoreductase-like domain-containing protein [Denitromonas ohlonensis]TVT49580.1 MAG: oxidoreductase [Denitromonas halophila]TVO68800.1 oxidoreductase [Denitromonas ohlonensis]TVO72834.1 oxidoreductase [Denitromonas ohlonensis]TVT75268.1 MAG: oxidoreductase [Denitromonas halophila]TVT76682.1 MAG: oxidoreductase [Denitromonas halophila]
MSPTASLRQAPLRHVDDAQALVVALSGELGARQLSLRPPPPIPDTCCGRGCNGCVWEGYFTALVYWRDDACTLIESHA